MVRIVGPRSLFVALPALALFLGACSADDRADGGTAADGGLVDDAGPADAGPIDTGDNEPLDRRTNDTFETANPIAVGARVEGTIGNYGAPGGAAGGDVDAWRFTAHAGDVLKITVGPTEGADYVPYVAIEHPAGGYSRMLYASEEGVPATRHFWIPADEEFVIFVRDLRNQVDRGGPVGGASCRYFIDLEAGAATVTPVTLPTDPIDGAFPADGTTQIYSFQLAPGWGVTAETMAERRGAGLDTILYLVDAAGGSLEVLAANDDLDDTTSDSRVSEIAARSGTHQVVVDYFDVIGTDLRFVLNLQAFDASQEQEPNDTPAAGNRVAGVGSAMHGAIHRTDPWGTQTGDVDVFVFNAIQGDYFEILVEPDAGANVDFIPAVHVVEPDGVDRFRNPNRGGATVARLEAYAFQTGPHAVVVQHAPNTNPPANVFAGGADFAYVLHINALQRTVTSLSGFPVTRPSAASVIDLGGKTTWFSFTVPAGGGALAWIDLDRSAGGGLDGRSLNPITRLYGTDGLTQISGGPLLLLRDRFLEPGTYTLTVSDADGGFSASHHAFRPRVASAGFVGAITDSGAHPTSAAALAISSMPAVVTTTLVAGAESWFDLGTLQAGSRVTTTTSASPSWTGDAVDTFVAVVRADGTTVIAENDDWGGTVYSKVAGALVPATERIYVRVKGALSWAAGPYRLHLQAGGCPAPAEGPRSGELFVNEVLAKPTGLGGDANGDGQVSAVGDQFVELVNSTNATRDLSDVVLRDETGVRWIAGCGLSLDGWKALPVFGACAGAGCQAANADPEAPTSGTAAGGLGLDAAGGTVWLLDRDGWPLDRVAYGAATDDVSFARGSGGVCDAIPVDATLLAHTACAGSASGFSPGLRVDGSLFQPPPARPGDTCANALALSGAVTLTGQSLLGYANDYDDDSTRTCTGMSTGGLDRVWSIVVPNGHTLDVTVTPTSAGFDPSVSFLTATAGTCNARPGGCLVTGAGDAVMENQPEQVAWTNSTGAAVTVFIVVDTWFDPGTFTLAVSL